MKLIINMYLGLFVTTITVPLILATHTVRQEQIDGFESPHNVLFSDRPEENPPSILDRAGPIECFDGHGFEEVVPNDCLHITTLLHQDGLPRDATAQWVPSVYVARPHTVPQSHRYRTCRLDITLKRGTLAEPHGPSTAMAETWIRTLVKECGPYGGLYQPNNLKFTIHRNRRLARIENVKISPLDHRFNTKPVPSVTDLPVNSSGLVSSNWGTICNPPGYHPVDFRKDCFDAIDDFPRDGLNFDDHTTWGRSSAIPRAHRVPQSYIRGYCRVDVSLNPSHLDNEPNGPSSDWVWRTLRRMNVVCRERKTGGYAFFEHLIFRAQYYSDSRAGDLESGAANNGSESSPSFISPTKRDISSNTTLGNSPSPTPDIVCNQVVEQLIDFRRDCQYLINNLPDDGLALDAPRPTWGQRASVTPQHRTPRSYSQRTCTLKIGLTPFWVRSQPDGPTTALARSYMNRLGILCRNKGGYVQWGNLRFSLIYNRGGRLTLDAGEEQYLGDNANVSSRVLSKRDGISTNMALAGTP